MENQQEKGRSVLLPQALQDKFIGDKGQALLIKLRALCIAENRKHQKLEKGMIKSKKLAKKLSDEKKQHAKTNSDLEAKVKHGQQLLTIAQNRRAREEQLAEEENAKDPNYNAASMQNKMKKLDAELAEQAKVTLQLEERLIRLKILKAQQTRNAKQQQHQQEEREEV